MWWISTDKESAISLSVAFSVVGCCKEGDLIIA
jgi:hypothetical protein